MVLIGCGCNGDDVGIGELQPLRCRRGAHGLQSSCREASKKAQERWCNAEAEWRTAWPSVRVVVVVVVHSSKPTLQQLHVLYIVA